MYGCLYVYYVYAYTYIHHVYGSPLSVCFGEFFLGNPMSCVSRVMVRGPSLTMEIVLLTPNSPDRTLALSLASERVSSNYGVSDGEYAGPTKSHGLLLSHMSRKNK